MRNEVPHCQPYKLPIGHCIEAVALNQGESRSPHPLGP